MSTTTEASTTPQHTSKALPPGQVTHTLRATGVSAAVATVANVLLLLAVTGLANQDITTAQSGTEQIVSTPHVIGGMVTATLLAFVAALISVRVFQRGRAVFAWGATLIALLTLHPFLAAQDTLSGVTLYAMHLIAGAIMIPMIVRSLPNR